MTVLGAKPRVTFADPEAKAVAFLLAGYAGREETYIPATEDVDTKYPAEVLAGNRFHVQVEFEGANTDGYPVVERNQVRIVCHGGPTKRVSVKALASLSQAILYSATGDADVAGVTVLPGRSAISQDPDTKNLSCWFLVRIDTKATPLAPVVTP